MRITIVSKDPPGGRCTLYIRYGEAIAEGCGGAVRVVTPGDGADIQPPALLAEERLIAPADGLILSPMDVYTGIAALGMPVAGLATLLARLEQVEADFMEGLSS
ncbi:MAG: hypothetical protein AB1918_01020 [Pseudomonadota bacterium]